MGSISVRVMMACTASSLLYVATLIAIYILWEEDTTPVASIHAL